MSAMSVEHHDGTQDDPRELADPAGSAPGRDGDDHAVVAGRPVVVRRHAGVAALIGAGASSVAILYLARAAQSMSILDWVLCGLMAVLAGYHLSTLVDSRTPLLVADDLGVRIRLGHEWRGLTWDALDHVQVHPRRGLLRDGRLVLVPQSLARAVEGAEARSRRLIRLNQRLYGAPLAVPMGLTTRVTVGDAKAEGLVEEISALALDRAEVVEVVPQQRDRSTEPSTDPVEEDAAAATARTGAAGTGLAEDDTHRPELEDRVFAGGTVEPELEAREQPREPGGGQDTEDGDATALPTEDRILVGEPRPQEPQDRAGEMAGRRMLGGLGTIVSRVAKGRGRDVDATGRPEETVPVDPDATASAPAIAALRETRPGARAEITRDPAPVEVRETPVAPTSTHRDLHRPGSVDLVYEGESSHVRPIARPGEVVDPLIIGDFVTEPAYDPVIGPELAAARTRLGLSVDELADRTRIRPHVIESIEVDDFGPCGGDFYARGHLRTLARFLGKEPAPLLAEFEDRYATAPINARRVFEAELATGMTGSMRATAGGPRWGMLVAMVLALTLVWAVVRVFAAEPAEIIDTTSPVLNGSAGIDQAVPVAPGSAGDVPGASTVPPLTIELTASQADTRISVRDGNGVVVYRGPIVLGERRTVQVVPPARVRAAAGGAVEVSVDGRDRGLLGIAAPAGSPREPAARTFRAPRTDG